MTERLPDRLLDEIRLGIATQFDESRIQQEDVIEEHTIALSVEEQLRHSGLLDEIERLAQERDAATRRAEALEKELDWFRGALGEAKLSTEALEAEVGRLRNPCSKIFDHKWLDPECVENGCQSLRAEAAEAENIHLRTQAGLPPIKTPHEQAVRETIDGQGLSMVAMGKELREKDDKIKALEAEVGRLWTQHMTLLNETHPPAADHMERAREALGCKTRCKAENGCYHGLDVGVAAALAAAERGGAEKVLQAARACASYRCPVDDGYPPRCPDCGATVTGNDPVRGRCQSDVIRGIKADVIEAYLRRALPLPVEEDQA